MENSEWLTRNCSRSFPLREDASRLSLNTQWTLPDFFLADASLTVPEADPGIYLGAVMISNKILTVVLASIATGASIAYASVVQGVNNSLDKVAVTPLIPGVSGYLTFGTALDPENFALLQQHQGQHVFATGLILEARCILDTGIFPVTSMAALAAKKITGVVSIDGTDELLIGLGAGEDQGDPVAFLTLSLKNPSRFLSPCEHPMTVCDCPEMPILTINGVAPDQNGTITIEVVDQNGNVYLVDPSVLNFLITRSGIELCNRPKMPDQYGRLPDGTGQYSGDLPPATPYRNPGDTGFPNPLL